MRFFNGDPNMPILEETYEPPLARLSVEQHRELRKVERRRKPFRELEARAARLLGELTLDELESAAYEIVEKAEELAGHDWRNDSRFFVSPHVDDTRGVVWLDVNDSEWTGRDARERIVLGSYARPDVEFVIPADREAWPSIIEKLAVRVREEIDKVAAGGDVIDIRSRRNGS